MRIAFFGHFGSGNLGNESTLQAILYHLRRRVPDVEVICICSSPEVIAKAYDVTTVSISGPVVRSWAPRKPVTKFLRKLLVGIPNELYRWLKCFTTLKGTDVLIIPGTGLLTDAWSLHDWGPYNLFKWSLTAKLCGCKLFFVSVGGGPINSRAGKLLVKSALILADFRSYRDESTMEYLESIGFRTHKDQIYPDLVFSLPEDVVPCGDSNKRRRPIVGLGLMKYSGKRNVDTSLDPVYLSYLDALVIFVQWLLTHDYDIRFLIGDFCDRDSTRDFRSLLRKRSVIYEEGRIIDEPISSAGQLLSQLAGTDLVVATRFHNVLLALLLRKPVISISFHHKCTSLMRQMGMPEYSQDIEHLNSEDLIEQFRQLEGNAESLKQKIKYKVEECRHALDQQYSLIIKNLAPQ